MENTQVHKQLKATYIHAHEELSHAMNLPANGMSIFEAGQLFKMIDRDLQTLFKRIDYLSLGDGHE